MTTKELINQYVTAHADNRWMDASELEALLTEFAEKLKEPASEDLEQATVRYARAEYDHKNPATLPDRCRGCYAPIMYAFKAGAQWQKEQMKKDAIECTVSLSNGRPVINSGNIDVDAEFGDKVKVIILPSDNNYNDSER